MPKISIYTKVEIKEVITPLLRKIIASQQKGKTLIVGVQGGQGTGKSTIVHYLKHLYARKDCALVLTGFQIPKTAGRYLVDTGRYVTDELDLKLGMQLFQLSFSGHAGRSELLRFVKNIRPKKVVCMHGDQCHRFATELKSRFSIEGLAPKPGEIIEI